MNRLSPRPRPSPPDAGAPIPWAALALIFGAAVLARGIGLNGGLWIDEIYSLMRSFRAPLGTILTDYWGDNHHPLYAVLAHASRALFGEWPWSLRLPALLFGVATIPALYALARRVVARREALLACGLLAVSYHHVWFSQNARGYSAIACFTVLLMWLALRGLEGAGRAVWLSYGVIAALAAFTHLTAVFIVLGQALGVGIYLLGNRREPGAAIVARRAAAAFAAGALLTLALYSAMLPDVIDYFLNRPSRLLGVSTARWAALEGVRVVLLGLSGGVLAVGFTALALGALSLTAGLVSLWRRSPAFVLLSVMPVACTFLGALAARGTMYPRFFFFAIAPALVIVLRGLFAMFEYAGARLRLRGAARASQLATAAAVLLIAASMASLIPNYRYPKQDFEGAMRYVLAAKGPQDAVVSTGVPADPYRGLWRQPWPNVETVQQLGDVRRGAPRTWVLYTFPRYLEARLPEVAAVIQRECRSERVFRGTVGGGDIVVCTLEHA
ncbi:MAG: glycosyltransferase family 39 protein [Gemmatimonadaceae bacterium]